MHREAHVAAYDGGVTPVRSARFTPVQANVVAHALERRGWRAESCIALPVAYVEVRDLSKRWTPLVAVLRSHGELDAFLAAHPGHGLRGRLAACTGETPPPARPAHGGRNAAVRRNTETE